MSQASNSPSNILCVGCGLVYCSCFRSPPQSTQQLDMICHFILNALKIYSLHLLELCSLRKACSLGLTSLLCSCCDSFGHTLTCIPYTLRTQVLIPNTRQLTYANAVFIPHQKPNHPFQSDVPTLHLLIVGDNSMFLGLKEGPWGYDADICVMSTSQSPGDTEMM